MRKTIAGGALGLSLLASFGCDNGLCKLFNLNCKPEAVGESWIDWKEHDSIVIGLKKDLNGISNDELFGTIEIYRKNETSGGYSLRAINLAGEVVFYQEFDFANSRADLVIPRRIDLLNAEIYDSSCNKVLDLNLEGLAIKY